MAIWAGLAYKQKDLRFVVFLEFSRFLLNSWALPVLLVQHGVPVILLPIPKPSPIYNAAAPPLLKPPLAHAAEAPTCSDEWLWADVQ